MKNQVNALAVLSVGEIEQVSGAGTFLGDAIINGVYAANSFLNSPLFSSIGNAASAIGLNRTHELVDLLAFRCLRWRRSPSARFSAGPTTTMFRCITTRKAAKGFTADRNLLKERFDAQASSRSWLMH